eukprot:692165-Hanusia_phi.AAC.3
MACQKDLKLKKGGWRGVVPVDQKNFLKDEIWERTIQSLLEKFDKRTNTNRGFFDADVHVARDILELIDGEEYVSTVSGIQNGCKNRQRDRSQGHLACKV